MGIFSSEHYNTFHKFEEPLFNSNPVRCLYNAYPRAARLGGLAVVPIWVGIKTLLSPVVDVVCLAVFPILFVKTLDRKYCWGMLNAAIQLASDAAIISLTILLWGSGGWQTVMIVVCVFVGIGKVTPKVFAALSMAIGGPRHPADREGLGDILFDKFSFRQSIIPFLGLIGGNPFVVALDLEPSVIKYFDEPGGIGKKFKGFAEQ